MIIFLTTEEHNYTLNGLFQSPIADGVVVKKSYQWLFSQWQLPRATYFFTDHERLNHAELALAGKIFTQLVAAGVMVFNNPAKLRCRHALLEHLHAQGINDFRVYPADLAPKPDRFPVFLKHENDHEQSFPDLIHTQSELDSCLQKVEGSGIPLTHFLVIEFSAKPIRDDIYEKHCAFRVGEYYITHESSVERNWCVKRGERSLMSEAEKEEKIANFKNNIFADLVKPAFEVGRIDYGRIDFGIKDDQICVYEINTNPYHLKRTGNQEPYFLAYMAVLDDITRAICSYDTPSGPAIEICTKKELKKRTRRNYGITYRVRLP